MLIKMSTTHIMNDLNKSCVKAINSATCESIDAVILILKEADVDEMVIMMVADLKVSLLSQAKKTKKRARTGYNLFVSDRLKFIKINNPDLKTRERMLKASEDWRDLAEDEKTRYRDMANPIPGIPEIPIKKLKIKVKLNQEQFHL